MSTPTDEERAFAFLNTFLAHDVERPVSALAHLLADVRSEADHLSCVAEIAKLRLTVAAEEALRKEHWAEVQRLRAIMLKLERPAHVLLEKTTRERDELKAQLEEIRERARDD